MHIAFSISDVKITRVSGLIEARTVHCSTLQCIVHSYKSIASKGTLFSLSLSLSTTHKFLRYIIFGRYDQALEYQEYMTGSIVVKGD